MSDSSSSSHRQGRQRLALLTAGRSVTVFADQLIELLILWFVWELTRSSAIMGLATFAGRSPFWIFAFYGATLVDRFGPLRLLRLCNTAAAVIASIAALKLALLGSDVFTFVLLAFALNTARSLEAAALAAAVPLLFPAGSHQKPNSWFDNAKRIGRLTAPLLSRWIGVLHPAAFVVLAGTAYAAMAVAAARISVVVDNVSRRVSDRGEFSSALTFVLKNRTLGTVIGLSAIYAFFHGIAYFVVLPRLSFDGDRNSPFSLGMIITLFGVGGILSNLVISRTVIREHVRAIGAGMIVVGVCFGLFATDPPTWARLVLALVAGASLPFQDVFITCAIQAIGPPTLVARLHATWRLACELTISLGVLSGGLLVDAFSAMTVGVISGAAIVLAGIVLVLFKVR